MDKRTKKNKKTRINRIGLKGEKRKRQNKLKKNALRFVLGGALLLLIVIPLINLYFLPKNVGFWYPIYRVLPLPIARVDNEMITSRVLLEDLKSVKHFYESNDYASRQQRVDFSTREGQFRLQIKEKDIFNKLIEDAIVRHIATKQGLIVKQEEVDRAIKESLNKFGVDEQRLALNLQDNYGWTIEDFKNKVVKNQLLLKKLWQWYQRNIQTSVEYNKAEEILEILKEDNSKFAELAMRYSDGESRKQGGEMNWMKESQIIPEVVERLANMESGDISGVIISPLGFHIVLLEDVKKNNNTYENNKQSGDLDNEYKFKQIFIRGKSFVDWLVEQKRLASVSVFWKKYLWNKNEGEVIFRDLFMRQKESEMRLKSSGDPVLN